MQRSVHPIRLLLALGGSWTLSLATVIASPADSTDSATLKILARAQTLFDQAGDVHYEHLHCPAINQIQNAGKCSHNDCSGFVSFLLANYAPQQYSVILNEQPTANYPQAKTYARYFVNLESAKSGWKRIESISDLQRGDFVAWAKKVVPGQKSGNSGHVAIVAEAPGTTLEEITIDGTPYKYLPIKVIDSSSVDHFAPDRLPPNAGQKHRDGLGEGFVRIIVDEQKRPIGYWEGTFWNEGGKPILRPSFSDMIGFARLVIPQD